MTLHLVLISVADSEAFELRHYRIKRAMKSLKICAFVCILAGLTLKTHAFLRYRFSMEDVEDDDVDDSVDADSDEAEDRKDFKEFKISGREGATKEDEQKTSWGNLTLKLDHFNPQDKRRFDMRYAINDQFFKKGGPIFIFLGGEWNISARDLTTGQIYDMAKAHDGYMFYTEHRFYGFSRPTPDLSTKNLKYLSVEQAMADIVYFIQHIKETIEGLKDSKVVIIGCSYAATMGTWLRQKYPYLIDMVYASGGPLQTVVDFPDYFEAMGALVRSVSQKCYDIIAEGISQLQEKLETPEGRSEISEDFHTCEELRDDKRYKASFFHTIATSFAADFQTGGIPIMKKVCKEFEESDDSPIDIIKVYMSETYNGTQCFQDYGSLVKNQSKIEFPEDGKFSDNCLDRAWVYQSCTQFGYCQTTESNTQPWGNTVDAEFLINYCTDLFGEGFGLDMITEGTDRMNKLYGALNPEVTKVLTVHSKSDAWSKLGLQKERNPLAPVILTEGSKHCADLHPINLKRDTKELVAVKRKAQKYISEWLRK